MYSIKLRSLQIFWIIAVIILLISGCASTIDYKNIQNDFTKAVEADNLQSYDPQMLGTLTTTYQHKYEDVIQRLKEPNIQSIDPRLKMNAYTMKAISQWRTGRLDEARQTVALSQAQPDASVGARDKMVLRILPALITDQELTQKYRRLKVFVENPLFRKLSYQDYKKDFEKGYYQAVYSLKDAIKKIPPELPENMVDYIHFQRWRILKNWLITIFSMPEGNSRGDAYQVAKNLLDVDLNKEIENEINAVKQGAYLWNLMKSFTLPKLPIGKTPPKPTETKL